MAIAKERVERVFKYNNRNLPDPNPKLTPEQVKDQFAAQYPELATAVITGPALVGGKQVYAFERAVGTKG